MTGQFRSLYCRLCSSIQKKSWLRSHGVAASTLPHPGSMRHYSRKAKKESDDEALPGSIAEKFVPFEDRQRIIRDIHEQQREPKADEEDHIQTSEPRYPRGKTGVFDLPELVSLMKKENAMDICVIRIPKELDYADFMVICTARNSRHLQALANFVRKRFKMKELKQTDRLPLIEGSRIDDQWLALDMVNIVLHVFTRDARELYDLETLWSVGSKFDDLSNAADSEIVQLLNLFK